MKYPRKSPYLVYSQTRKNEFIVENRLTSEIYRLDPTIYAFLMRLDGRVNPCKLLPGVSRNLVQQLMKSLRRRNLLAPEKGLQKTGVGSYIYPLIFCYPGKIQKYLAKMWNYGLMMAFIPMLAIGLFLGADARVFAHMQNKSELYVGMVLGVVVGLFLHELSHMCAGLTYGGHIFEIGIGTHFFLPMGYVLLDVDHIRNAFNRFQINMAGIEMNLLLYGVFICLTPTGLFSPFVLYLAAVENLMLAVFNLLPLEGLDGIKVLSDFLGKADILTTAKEMIKQKERYRKSVKGVSAIIAAHALVGFQLVMPILLIYEGYCFVRLILL